jgi:hypothetical protein
MYGLLAWGNASNYHINRITSIQNKIIKTIVPKNIKEELNSNLPNLSQFCQVLPVSDLYIYRFLLKFYFANNLKNLTIYPAFTRLSLMQLYDVPTWKNKHGKRCILYLLPLIYNSLPANLKDLQQMCQVKKEIKMWLLKKLDVP